MLHRCLEAPPETERVWGGLCTLRQKISRENKNTIHNILIEFYKKRLSEKYKLFLSDRGEQTLIDDIPTLSSFTTIDQL